MARAQRCPCGAKVSAATRGRAGTARKAGLCYPCWKKRHDASAKLATPPAEDAPGPLGDLETSIAELEDITQGLAGETAELLERARRFASDCKRRVDAARGTIVLIERQTREAGAEMRRTRSAALEIRTSVQGALKGLPSVDHGGNGKQCRKAVG